MYSRHKLRKEQQLLNLRQLSPKSGSQSSAPDNGNQSVSPESHSSTADSMANRSSLSANQSSKASRGVTRVTAKRDMSSANESLAKTCDTNYNSMLRSVNRSPTVRSQTLRSAERSVTALQTRTTHSPTARTNASLPQSLASNAHKPSLTQTTSRSSGDGKQRQPHTSDKTAKDDETPHKSLSTTPMAPTCEAAISPEILFLVREQAKSIAKINALERKVEQLVHTIKGQNLNDTSGADVSNVSSSSTMKLVNKTLNASKDRMAVSDDSGGEYSRATTASDEDELSLLLDQIVRRSQQLQTNSSQHIQHIQHIATNNRFTTNTSIANQNSICGQNHTTSDLMTQTMQTRPKWHPYASAASHSTQHSPTRETLDHKLFSNSYSDRVMATSAAQASAPPLPAPPHSPYCQPISALLFEPNVENVLKNLDEIIANEAIDSNRFSNSSTLSQTYQRSQTSQHSSQSLYDAIGVTTTPATGASHLNTSANSGSTANQKLDYERAMNLVKQREERELDLQMRLNEEWLQTQLKTQESNCNPNNTHFRRHNFIDSLEPTFR